MIRATPSCLIALAIFYAADLLPVYAIALLCGFWHELGHVLMMRLFHQRPQAIILRPFGIQCVAEEAPYTSYRQDMLIALGGPLMSGVGFLAGLLLGDARSCDGLFIWTGVNLLLMSLNLFPILPLDGGRFLEALLKGFLSFERAEQICLGVSLALSLLLTAFGVLVLVVSGYNLSLLLIGCYLLWNSIKKLKDMA